MCNREKKRERTFRWRENGSLENESLSDMMKRNRKKNERRKGDE
jgi:hypothetical protein